MKNKFSGYYNPTPIEFANLWKDCVFVVDTNVLLDLYRLSPNVQEVLWGVLDDIKERIWIPYQVAEEYHRNIFSVIVAQVKKCKDAILELDNLKNKVVQYFSSTRNFPYIEESLKKKVEDVCEELSENIRNESDEINNLIYNNPTKERLAKLLENKVGEELSEEKLNDIYKDGERRYAKNVPPGYADARKKNGDDKYGDLVIWKEIIKYAKNNKKDIILITSDNKEDWYNKCGERTTGPRSELRMEFKKEVDKMFYAYTLSSFLENAGKYLLKSTKITSGVIEEVASVSIDETESVGCNAKEGDVDFVDGIICNSGEIIN